MDKQTEDKEKIKQNAVKLEALLVEMKKDLKPRSKNELIKIIQKMWIYQKQLEHTIQKAKEDEKPKSNIILPK